MNKASLSALLVVLAAVGLTGGFLLQQRLSLDASPAAPPPAAETLPGQRPAFALPDLDGTERHIGEWDGRVLMINFWATWCPPCRREIPAFVELQEAYEAHGLTIIGVALDSAEAVSDFVDPMGINYPLLVGETEGIAIAKAYGNRLGALPYTVFVDRAGRVIDAHRTELSFEEAEAIIRPLL